MNQLSDKIKDVAEIVSLSSAFIAATAALSIFVINRLAEKKVSNG